MKTACKKKKMVTVGTQTAVDLYPMVILRKISLSQEYPAKTSTTVSKPVAKAPANYQNFVKRLSNNQKASSTLVSKEFEGNVEENCLIPPAPPTRNQSKRVKFKPGPRCYKRRLLRSGLRLYEDDGDMNVPIMLSEPSSPNENLTNIQTIIANASTRYQNFAQRLTDNQSACSTLVNKESVVNAENRFPPPSTSTRGRKTKRVTFRPGPQCYKNRLLENESILQENVDFCDVNYDDMNMNVPIMLSEPTFPNENVANLQTIIEQTRENCETPEIPIDDGLIDIEEIENVEIPTVHSLDIAYQNLESDEVNENDENEITSFRNRLTSIQNKAATSTQTAITQHHTSQLSSKSTDVAPELQLPTEVRASQNEDNSLRQNEQDRDSIQPVNHTENIHIHFAGVTNIVSHKSYRGERKESSSSEQNEDASRNDTSESSNASFIKIMARNVHIHNHFY